MAYCITRDEHFEDKNYQKYLKRKLKIQKKYKEWNVGGTQDCKKYIAEVAELFSTDKDFQKFVWENMSEGEKNKRMRMLNPRKQGQRYPTIQYHH
jgi:hypothetical protein